MAKIDYAPSSNPQVSCSGGIIWIYWTRYNHDPKKDTGDSGNCNGGNGSVVDNKVSCPGTPMETDPINTATGNKYQQDTDFLSSSWLAFRRFYNSTATVAPSTLGPQWRHSFDRSLAFVNTLPDGSGNTYIVLYRPDGRGERFQSNNNVWTADADIADTLTEQRDGNGHLTGYLVFMATPQQFERYSTTGLLQSITDESGQVTTLTYSGNRLQTVTDPNGRSLTFDYGGDGRLHTLTQPDGGILTYSYSAGNLAVVKYPDGATRQYIYNESSLTSGTSQPTALTGVIDEAGVRFDSTGYDALGRAISSSLAGGADAATVKYTYPTTLTTPLGNAVHLYFENHLGALKFSLSRLLRNSPNAPLS